MKKSLLVTLEYPPQIGGVAHYYSNLVNNLPAEKILVLTNEKNKLLWRIPFLGWIKSFFTIKKFVKENDIEIIMVGQILPLGTVVWLLSKWLKIPYVVFIMAMEVTYVKQYRRKQWLMKKILVEAKKIITISTYTKFEILKLISSRYQRKIEIIFPVPNIVPSKYPEAIKECCKKHKPVLLTVGRLVQRKGHDMVIKALPEILKEIPNLQYIIVGDGNYKNQLKKLVSKLNLDKQVIFTGELSDQKTASYYAIADVFIMVPREMPNRDVEGFGIVYLEANSFEKPVIGGQSGGVTDAVVDGYTGFLVEPENTSMICQAVVRLITNKDMAHKMGYQGKIRVDQEFNLKAKAQQLQNILL
ncbi:MAG: glycosyltransferase family 4 protein [Patescibacteria group bacterium]